MGRSHSAMATRAIILLFLAAIVTIWADTAEVQTLEDALDFDNTPSPVSGSAAIELEDDRLGEDDNMGAGRGGGFLDRSSGSFQLSSGGSKGGNGFGGEEAADALLEEDEQLGRGMSMWHRRRHSATTQHRIVESTEKREAHERTQKGPQPT